MPEFRVNAPGWCLAAVDQLLVWQRFEKITGCANNLSFRFRAPVCYAQRPFDFIIDVGSLDPGRLWFVNDQRLGRKVPNMLIIGVDYHPSDQQIALTDTETGECGERRLNRSDQERRSFIGT